MPRIKQLPDDLITRIAAGEVVDRPASILKELIENSLDAGATEIRIAVDGAGRSRISVSDNGVGMAPDDARLALQRHATSKISRLDDLETLETFGFRGEALPSIASVSKLTLQSKTDETDEGWSIQIEGGKILSEKPTANERGTRVEVRDVFFNTPARFKFLKSDATERAQCWRVVEDAAFSSPGVSFHAEFDKGRPVLFQHPELKTRIAAAWGKRVAEGMVPVSTESPHFKIDGWVSDPHNSQGSARSQVLFINRRPVLNRRITRAVYDGFLGQLPVQRHPAWVLFLSVDPKTVDVNVHPTKREVKLTHEAELYSFVRSAIQSALNARTAPAEPSRWKPPDHAYTAPAFHPFEKRSTAAVAEAVRQMYKPLFSPPESIRPAELKAISQVNRMFILAENPDGVWIVDQHAGAERVAYESIMEKGSRREIQKLMVPYSWEVARSLHSLVLSRLEEFRALGFDLEPFGGETILVKGLPSVLGEKKDLLSVLDGLSDVLSDEKKGETFQHRLAAMAACKASVKAGDKLSLEECQALLDRLSETESPLTCPHGRPTFLKFEYGELERRFRRR